MSYNPASRQTGWLKYTPTCGHTSNVSQLLGWYRRSGDSLDLCYLRVYEVLE